MGWSIFWLYSDRIDIDSVRIMIPIDFQPETEQDHARCLLDKGWRLNNHYTIADRGGNPVRFRQNAAQRRIFLEKHGCDYILKSRRHGITTEKCLEILDDCLHSEKVLTCGLIAHTQPAAWAIFSSKVRFVYDKLPDWVKNNNPAVEFSKSHVKFRNDSSFRVATSFQSDAIHRLHVSEYGPMCAKFPNRAEAIKGDTLPAVHPDQGGEISFESTADGGAGGFFDGCQISRADTKRSELTGIPLNPYQYKFHFLSWQDDPNNATDPLGVNISTKVSLYFNEIKSNHDIDLTDQQKAWYYLRRDGAGGMKRAIKRHYPSTPDEAFEQSVDGGVYTEEIADLYDRGRVGDFPWVKEHPVFTFWDLGISKGNACCIVFAQFIKDTIRIIDYYECEGRGGTYHASQMLAKPYTWPPNDDYCYLPHDGKNRDKFSAIPFKDSMTDLGLKVENVVKPENKDLDGIQAVRGIFPKLQINLMPAEENRQDGEPYNGTDRLIKGLKFYRYKWDEDLKQWSKSPIHDWASNPADALQTLALGYKYCPIGGEYIGDDSIQAAYIDLQNGETNGVHIIPPMSWI